MLGKPIMTVSELLQAVENDDAVWDLYANGMTVTLNQCDSEWATKLVSQYKPRNLAELAKFISCLRPFFNSSRDTFIARSPYSTGSKYLDDVLKSSDGYILFQESLMQYFEWLSIKPAESIGLIKKISKKKIKPEDFANLKERLRQQWIANTGSEDMFETTFQNIHDCMSYGFAAPHALAVAIDSLYGAYLKAHHPLEYYAVCLNNYVGDEERTNRLTEELSYFGITLKGISFRYSGADYTIDRENNAIYKGIASLAYFGASVAQKLFALREQKLDNFIEFLELNPCDSRQTIALIYLGYFSEFGKSQYLLNMYEDFKKFYHLKQIKSSDLKTYPSLFKDYGTFSPSGKTFYPTDIKTVLLEFAKTYPDKNIPIADRIRAEDEYLGRVEYVNPKAVGYGYITHIDLRYSPRLKIYLLATGKVEVFKMQRKAFDPGVIREGVLIKFKTKKENKRYKKHDKWRIIPDEYETWITEYKSCEV